MQNPLNCQSVTRQMSALNSAQAAGAVLSFRFPDGGGRGAGKFCFLLPQSCPGGEIGRRKGLKIPRLMPCRFESGPGHHLINQLVTRIRDAIYAMRTALSLSNPKPDSHRKYDYRHYYLDPQFSAATHGKPRGQSRTNHTTHTDDDARTPVNLPHPGKDNESR